MNRLPSNAFLDFNKIVVQYLTAIPGKNANIQSHVLKFQEQVKFLEAVTKCLCLLRLSTFAPGSGDCSSN